MKQKKWQKPESTRYVFSLPVKLKTDAIRHMEALGFRDFSRYLRHLLRKDMNQPDIETKGELESFRDKIYYYLKPKKEKSNVSKEIKS